jgi:hypothetical protein
MRTTHGSFRFPRLYPLPPLLRALPPRRITRLRRWRAVRGVGQAKATGGHGAKHRARVVVTCVTLSNPLFLPHPPRSPLLPRPAAHYEAAAMLGRRRCVVRGHAQGAISIHFPLLPNSYSRHRGSPQYTWGNLGQLSRRFPPRGSPQSPPSLDPPFPPPIPHTLALRAPSPPPQSASIARPFLTLTLTSSSPFSFQTVEQDCHPSSLLSLPQLLLVLCVVTIFSHALPSDRGARLARISARGQDTSQTWQDGVRGRGCGSRRALGLLRACGGCGRAGVPMWGRSDGGEGGGGGGGKGKGKGECSTIIIVLLALPSSVPPCAAHFRVVPT